jgi:hypothetical protein
MAATTARSGTHTFTSTTVRPATKDELGFITLAAAAEIAREQERELDLDGPTREEWDEITEPPRRSFLSRLLGR